jgi:quercetin dioxygenase-like cupin family protein
MRKAIRSPLLAMTLVLVFAGSVLATGATGFHPAIQARGTINERTHVHNSAGEFEAKGSLDVVTATVTIDPLGSSGWHSHPGMVFVTVMSGSLVFYDDHCRATVYAAGSAFVESGNDAGLVRNESTTTAATVAATYVVPAGTPNPALRVDMANPGCPKS